MDPFLLWWKLKLKAKESLVTAVLLQTDKNTSSGRKAEDNSHR